MRDLFEKIYKDKGPLGKWASQAEGYFVFPKLEGQISNRMKFQGKDVITWSINDYLGLANHPEVRKVDAEAIKEQQKTESLNFQKEIYSWLLKRKMKGQFVVDFQEVDYTNAKLKKAGYPDEPMTTEEICTLLKVDGLVKSNFGLSKPMGDGAAIAAALLLGGAGATNEVRINFSINDCKSKSLIFSYDHKYSGGMGSSPSRLVDGMMRDISRKMPHYISN